MMDIVHEDVKQRKVGSLCPPNKRFANILVLLPLLERHAAVRLEPCWQDTRVQPNLGGDVECELDNARLGIQAEAHTINAGDADEEVGQAGGKSLVLDESLLFALNQSRKEEDSFLDDPLIVRSRGDLADGDVDLLERAVLDAWVWKRSAALVA